jgi:23S rRNA pseudouridine1911/1915/1917 synthase
MPDELELIVTAAEAGQRLDVFVAARVPSLSRSRVQRLLREDAILLNGGTAKPRQDVRADDVVRITVPDPQPAKPAAQDILLSVVHEDEDLLVIDKAAGIAVHPGAGIRDGTLVNALLGRNTDLSGIGGVMRPGIVHRLDRDTSGLLVVAKNDFAHRALSAALTRREITRIYWTIVLRDMREPSGTVEAPIGRHPSNRVKMAVVSSGGRNAETHWNVRERFHGFALVECRLGTGRTHQIRVHLSHIGHPVLGDSLYGGVSAAALQLVPPREQRLQMAVRRVARQMLHARELCFTHPRSGDSLRFESPLPGDFAAILAALRAAAGSR